MVFYARKPDHYLGHANTNIHPYPHPRRISETDHLYPHTEQQPERFPYSNATPDANTDHDPDQNATHPLGPDPEVKPHYITETTMALGITLNSIPTLFRIVGTNLGMCLDQVYREVVVGLTLSYTAVFLCLPVCVCVCVCVFLLCVCVRAFRLL